MTDNNKIDHVLIRVKDFLLIGGAVIAIVTWMFGIANLPETVKATVFRVSALESRQATSDLIVSGMQKDLSYLTKGIDEIKLILKEGRRIG